MVRHHLILSSLITLLFLIAACGNRKETKTEIQINRSIELLNRQIEIPFQVDSVFSTIITKDYDWELADYTLLAVIYPSNIDSVKSQFEGDLLKQISGDNFQRYSKDELQEWFVKKASGKILTTENYYQLEWNQDIYKADLFRKSNFIHGLCFEYENKIFIIINTN